ncbi:hypothetical protein BC941DRAFT_443067 [Chlamydoabsidia padenii]|nr:hypothetical protein BC941DRAFT_443067 [Chlamydoabsidia padenii]
MKKEFIKDDDTDMRILNRSFIKLGILSSLVFVRNVPGNIEDYIARVDLAVKELIIELDDFDIVFSDDHTPFSLKSKVHMLHHLPANIARFGPPLHYETEKGEQFNKFIREHIVNTNRHIVSRDIARLFGKQATLRHVLEGGSWNGINGITRCSKDVIDIYQRRR